MESAPVIDAKLVFIEDALHLETIDGVVNLIILDLLATIANALVKLSSVNWCIKADIILFVTKTLSAAQIENQSLILVEIQQINFGISVLDTV